MVLVAASGKLAVCHGIISLCCMPLPEAKGGQLKVDPFRFRTVRIFETSYAAAIETAPLSTKTVLKTALLTTSFSGICGLAGWLYSSVFAVGSGTGHNFGLFSFGLTFALSPLLVFPLVRKTHLLVQAHRDLEILARTDALTGVPNRRQFYETAETILRDSNAGGTVAAIMLDIDEFKALNDTYGHATGDAVLKAVADCLSEQLSRLVPDAFSFGRIGGEEFAVLMSGSSALVATRIAQNLVEAVRSLRVERNGQEIAVTVSAGTAVHGVPCTLDRLVSQADTALYTAKSAGRNRAIAADNAVAVEETDSRSAA